MSDAREDSWRDRSPGREIVDQVNGTSRLARGIVSTLPVTVSPVYSSLIDMEAYSTTSAASYVSLEDAELAQRRPIETSVPEASISNYFTLDALDSNENDTTSSAPSELNAYSEERHTTPGANGASPMPNPLTSFVSLFCVNIETLSYATLEETENAVKLVEADRYPLFLSQPVPCPSSLPSESDIFHFEIVCDN